MGRTKIWLDCDPGHDDAMAIMLAGHSPSVELLGLSTVAGNQTVEKTTVNALRVLSLADIRGVDVVMGQGAPLMRESKVCPEIHGSSGLGTRSGQEVPDLPPVGRLIPKKAIVHMYDVISQHGDGEVVLVATGSLTNVALLLMVFPEVKAKLAQIVLMGGAMGIGNTGPVAEFNIQCDPEAAKVVFECGVKLVQVPLEVTHTCLVTDEVVKALEAFDSPFGRLMIDLLQFFAQTYKDIFFFDFPPLHDPLTIAYVIDPSIFQTKLLRVDIETSSELSYGQTVVDVWQMSPKPRNVHVAQRVDVPAFWELMLAALRKANERSPLNSLPAGAPSEEVAGEVKQAMEPTDDTSAREAGLAAPLPERPMVPH